MPVSGMATIFGHQIGGLDPAQSRQGNVQRVLDGGERRCHHLDIQDRHEHAHAHGGEAQPESRRLHLVHECGNGSRERRMVPQPKFRLAASAASSWRMRQNSSAALARENKIATEDFAEHQRQHRDLARHHQIIGMAHEAIRPAFDQRRAGKRDDARRPVSAPDWRSPRCGRPAKSQKAQASPSELSAARAGATTRPSARPRAAARSGDNARRRSRPRPRALSFRVLRLASVNSPSLCSTTRKIMP